MLDNLLQFFKCYQTFIVGVLGFSGVIFTIFMNSKMSRDQHSRQIKHEQETVRTVEEVEVAVL